LSDHVTVVGGLLALVGDPLALVGDPLTLVGHPLTLIRGPIARVGHPLTLVRGDPSGPGLASLTTSPTLAAQPGTFALQCLIVGHKLRCSAFNLRPEAIDVDLCNIVALLLRLRAQLPQIGPLRFERCRLTLDHGAPALKVSPLRVAPRLPRGGRCLVALCALLMHQRRVSVRSPDRAGAHRRFHGPAMFDVRFRSQS
jgi:hypothetical protein